MQEIKSVLMVCLGNICRSLLAHGVLEAQAKEKGIELKVGSAGIDDWHLGNALDVRSIKVAKKYGYDISYQKARQIDVQFDKTFNLILGMDAENVRQLHELGLTKACLFGEFGLENESIIDTYYGDEKVIFKRFLCALKRALRRFWTILSRKEKIA